MKKNIVNTNALEWKLNKHGNFTYYEKKLGGPTGGEKLGATLYKLMPGKKTFPYHFHYANEEAIYVFEGSATLRLGSEKMTINSGDYIALPVGPKFAHQILNTSEDPIIFLCFSTMNHPDVVEYPDSNKVGVTAGTAPGGDSRKIILRKRFRKQDSVDYYDGEA